MHIVDTHGASEPSAVLRSVQAILAAKKQFERSLEQLLPEREVPSHQLCTYDNLICIDWHPRFFGRNAFGMTELRR